MQTSGAKSNENSNDLGAYTKHNNAETPKGQKRSLSLKKTPDISKTKTYESSELQNEKMIDGSVTTREQIISSSNIKMASRQENFKGKSQINESGDSACEIFASPKHATSNNPVDKQHLKER